MEIGSSEEIESAAGGSRSSIVACFLLVWARWLDWGRRTPRYLSAQAAVDVFVSEGVCFSRVKASLAVEYEAILSLIGMRGW